MTEEEKKKVGEQFKQEMLKTEGMPQPVQQEQQPAQQPLSQEQQPVSKQPMQQSGNNSQSAEDGDNPYGLNSGFMESWRKYSNNKNKTTQELIQALRDSDQYIPKTKDDEAKDAKRRKREGLIAAIGDGISALANLYGTTQGSLNSYDPRNSLSAALRRRWDRIDKEDKERKNSHVNTLMKMNELQNAADDEEIGWRKYFESARQKREAAKAKKKVADAKAAEKKNKDDRDYDLKVRKQNEIERANGVKERQNAEKIGISQQREGRLASGGSGSSSKQGKAYTPEHTRAAWNEWWRYTDEQRDEWRERFGNRGDAKDDDYFVNAVKQMHDDYLREKAGSGAKSGGSPAKRKPSPTGGKKAGGKKSPTA